MKNILTIFKKEWDRVIRDKRLVFGIMLLPGLMIFLVYSFIGNTIESSQNNAEYQVAIVNPTDSFQSIYELIQSSATVTVESIQTSEIDAYQQMIDDGDWQLLIIFDEAIETYTGGVDKPSVEVYFNQNKSDSSGAFSLFSNALMQYETLLSYDIYGDTSSFSTIFEGTPLNESELTGNLLASLLPMLVVMFLFVGSMAVGPESIAGEKERGTIATLLITPTKRSEIALGKILSLSVLSLLSAISSFIGIILSLPKLMMAQSMDIGIYGFTDYIMLLSLMFSTVLVIVGMISIISAYAKTLKEATILIMPLYIVTILIGLSSIMGNGANSNFFLYLVPIYNTVQTMTAILTFNPNTFIYLIITISSNLVLLLILVFVLNRMFNSEKIMFSK